MLQLLQEEAFQGFRQHIAHHGAIIPHHREAREAGALHVKQQLVGLALRGQALQLLLHDVASPGGVGDVALLVQEGIAPHMDHAIVDAVAEEVAHLIRTFSTLLNRIAQDLCHGISRMVRREAHLAARTANMKGGMRYKPPVSSNLGPIRMPSTLGA